mgnify:CR=1 FL=1
MFRSKENRKEQYYTILRGLIALLKWNSIVIRLFPFAQLHFLFCLLQSFVSIELERYLSQTRAVINYNGTSITGEIAILPLYD